MIIKFPDGNLFDTSGGWVPAMASSSPIIYFYDSNRSAASTFQFVCESATEQIFFLTEIYQALKDEVDFLELQSESGLPTNTDTEDTDMFFDAAAGTGSPYAVANNQSLFLTIGSYTTAQPWPPSPAGVSNGMPATFLPNGTLTIGGQPVQNLEYVNGLCLRFRAPIMAAGTYDLVYTDGRGSVTKVDAAIYS